MTKSTSVILLCVASIGLVSCSSRGGPNETGGTLVGGAAGALIGSQFGHGSGSLVGAAVGAAAGSMAGAAVGRNMDNQQEYYQRGYYQQGYYYGDY